MSSDIICPNCKENVLMNINNFKINLFGCKNNHKYSNIILNEFQESQKIDLNKIICDICKENKRGNAHNNEFYICNTCNKNMCPLCMSIHDKKHKIINYDDKNYVCKKHNESFNKYCKTCNNNICVICENKHKNHEILDLINLLIDEEVLLKLKEDLKNIIDKFKSKIKITKEILNKMIYLLNIYYKINDDIMNNYNINKRNYHQLKNLNYLIKNNSKLMKDLNNVINSDKISEIYKFSLDNIYNDKGEKYGNEFIEEKHEDLEKEEIKKLKDVNKKMKIYLEKVQNEFQKGKEELNLKLIKIQKKESQLKEDRDKLTKENNKINDLILLNQQKEKDIEIKINLLKKEQKGLEEEKNKFNNIKNQLIQKENVINMKQLKLRKNKIEEKDEELNQREKIIAKKGKKYKVVLIGLNNIGATCYMNATFQCLSNSKDLTEYFLNLYKKAPNKIMANEYYEVIKNLWDVDSKNKSYSPISFKEVLAKENPLFTGIEANDSKDLINFLLERFHQELNVINTNIKISNNDINNNEYHQPDNTNELAMLKDFLEDFVKKFNSPISNLFYGILKIKTKCQGCNTIKYNFQIYSFFDFPLQEVNQYYYNLGKRPLLTKEGKNPDIDLYECFEYNRKIDLMTGENQMYCNNCNKLCNAKYSTTLYSGPNYLIINLNRGKGGVYECKVNFPNQLNIFNYVDFKEGITVYELYGVICHIGPSSMSGHFVAYCRNRIDNQWYLYNDSIVTKCTSQFKYNDGIPYILFYRGLTSD